MGVAMNECGNEFFKTDIGITNNFASEMHYKMCIIFELYVIECTSLWAPKKRASPFFF